MEEEENEDVDDGVNYDDNVGDESDGNGYGDDEDGPGDCYRLNA